MIELKDIAKAINEIDHNKLQLDWECEHEKRNEIFDILNKLEKEKAIKLLFHIIHAQQLSLLGAHIIPDDNNPCKSLIDFKYIDKYCLTKKDIK